jgi:hypothetical protein
MLDMGRFFLSWYITNIGFYDYTSEASSSGDAESSTEKSQEPIIDILPQLYDLGSTGARGPSSGMWARTLRLKITGRDGVQKIDARIPVSVETHLRVYFLSVYCTVVDLKFFTLTPI